MTSTAAIAAWLPGARWFAGKGAGDVRVSIHAAAAIPGAAITLALVDVDTAPDHAHDRYVVPLAGSADAALAPAFAGWLVQAVLSEAVLPADHGAFRGHRVGSPVEFPGVASETVSVAPLGGDASNTSLRVTSGRRQYAVKLVRRCRPGHQPEVEIGQFLSRADGWTGSPRLHGWLEHIGPAGESTVIATVHEFAAGCTTAWDHLGALLAAGGLQGPPRASILDVATTLGRLTGQMHRTLASRADLPAFAPVRPTAADMQSEARRMVEHAGMVLDRACARIDELPPNVTAGVRGLLGKRDEIVATLGRLAVIDSPAALVRVHGDYHLGQVLLHAPGPEAFVIDFEGEPGRSLAERRRKTSVCKDIAGMCRSFDYLLREAARTRGVCYRREDRRLLESAFLEAYRGVARHQPWWPDDSATADALLAIYTLDKALYELAYELANRPDWVEVPLAALIEGVVSSADSPTAAPR